MKFEMKMKGLDKDLVFEDAKDMKHYEVSMVNRRTQGASVYIGTLSKADLKRLAKAS